MKRWALAAAMLAATILATSAPATAGDAFFKGGLRFHPDVGDFSDKWFLSIGSDWDVHEQAFVGFELQGAYYSNSISGLGSVNSLPTNIFVNGKWKAPTEGVRPYAGVGLGMVSAYVRTDIGGVTSSEYIRDAGLQLMGGVELNRRFLLELLGQKVFEDGTEFAWSILGGFRW